MSRTTIRVYRDLLESSAEWAAKTRALAAAHRIRVVNLIGSPGAGKTRLLEASATRMRGRFRFAVLEGDVATTRDAERLAAVGVQVCQLLTEGGCHLPARLVHDAFRDLPLDRLDVVIVENVGNLVCPAEIDIGEAAKVAVLSVTEGEDKPLKYPALFRTAQAVVLSKIDLLPHLAFDLPLCLGSLRRVNGSIPVFQVSAATDTGLDGWLDWLAALPAAPPEAARGAPAP